MQSAVWRAIFGSEQPIDDEPETVINPPPLQTSDYHPEQIDDPTFVSRASSDETISQEGALNFYDAVGAADHRKQYTETVGRTHFIFLERKRCESFHEVYDFQQQYAKSNRDPRGPPKKRASNVS